MANHSHAKRESLSGGGHSQLILWHHGHVMKKFNATHFLPYVLKLIRPSIAIIHSLLLTLSACTRVTVLILFVCVCVCVSLTTLEAALIYSDKNGHQWTANGILFIFKKLKFCKLAPSIQKQPSKLTALYCTSYGHAHLPKFKVHFVIIFSRLCALRVSTSVPFIIMEFMSLCIQSRRYSIPLHSPL